jgi:PTS system nitrogen regulatory IIA component
VSRERGPAERRRWTLYLKLPKLAEALGVSESLVLEWVREEGLPHVVNRGALLFERGQVMHWAASRGLAAQTGLLASDKAAAPLRAMLMDRLRAGGIWRDVPAALAIDRMVAVVDAIPGLGAAARGLLRERLRAPGGIAWAPIGDGFALPHFASRVSLGAAQARVALLCLRDPLVPPEEPVDDVPITRLVFFVPASPRAHAATLGLLVRLLSQPRVREVLARSLDDREMLAAVAAEPPAHHVDREGAR